MAATDRLETNATAMARAARDAEKVGLYSSRGGSKVVSVGFGVQCLNLVGARRLSVKGSGSEGIGVGFEGGGV